MNATDLWRFSDTFCEARRAALSSVRTFFEVIDFIGGSIESIQVVACRGRSEGLESYVQPIFTLSVSPSAFDCFFNGPAGYRACYLQDPQLGLAANLTLIQSLAERLHGAAMKTFIPELAAIDVKASILATSCKVWVHEDDFPFQSLTKDLAIERWVSAAASGERKAIWGLCAPQGTRIQIKGALLSPQGNEVVPTKKVLRRFEIHRYGFS